jgi:hypothetical protein
MPKQVRYLNGYRVVFVGEHASAMRSDNWDGWIYEHILVAETFMERPLRSNEDVHHLNGDRADNSHKNLLVLEKTQHTKLHNWLRNGAPGLQNLGVNRVNSGNSNASRNTYCAVCDAVLKPKQTTFCSKACHAIKGGKRKVPLPSKQTLEQDIATLSWAAIGRKYGVTCNAVRRWARKYDLL